MPTMKFPRTMGKGFFKGRTFATSDEYQAALKETERLGIRRVSHLSPESRRRFTESRRSTISGEGTVPTPKLNGADFSFSVSSGNYNLTASGNVGELRDLEHVHALIHSMLADLKK